MDVPGNRQPYENCAHWRRLVKNIGWANKNIGGGENGGKK